ncbi:Uncharacterised protein (plasmid) [Legionella adelaidensis]|jgi:hypothetical protein|uniref:Uncharacterized protein n=1 Tax=Legionella adelaidensis TaxID=45056 RepID=A0A448NBG0_9GAMM|nr:hypothetical protein [Legionella adelaidensis]VEH85251.1 Uncharacterised protein [Legionella adelaidensis]
MDNAKKGFFQSKFSRFFYRIGAGVLEAIATFATDSRISQERV